MVELTYVALKPVRVRGKRRLPGELVPEATSWRHVSAWVSQGTLTPVPRDSVDQEALKKAEDDWKSHVEANAPAPEPDEEHPVEEFARERGWYEIPGHETKMRRDEAIAFLEAQEGGEE